VEWFVPTHGLRHLSDWAKAKAFGRLVLQLPTSALAFLGQ